MRLGPLPRPDRHDLSFDPASQPLRQRTEGRQNRAAGTVETQRKLLRTDAKAAKDGEHAAVADSRDAALCVALYRFVHPAEWGAPGSPSR